MIVDSGGLLLFAKQCSHVLSTLLLRIFQLKVGGAPSDDIARIHAVRAMLDAKVGYISTHT
jgi:hypothetical protein